MLYARAVMGILNENVGNGMEKLEKVGGDGGYGCGAIGGVWGKEEI